MGRKTQTHQRSKRSRRRDTLQQREAEGFMEQRLKGRGIIDG